MISSLTIFGLSALEQTLAAQGERNYSKVPDFLVSAQSIRHASCWAKQDEKMNPREYSVTCGKDHFDQLQHFIRLHVSACPRMKRVRPQIF